MMGRRYRIFSWNVNGVRAVVRKGALQKFIAAERPDILALQETKAKQGQAEIDFPEYEEIWNSAERSGYSGTATFTKVPPMSIKQDFGSARTSSWADDYGDPLCEGRVQVVEYLEFYLVNVYTPNSKRDLSRLKLRAEKWDAAFLCYLRTLEREKPVVACGDFNAAHTEIDLARPAQNHHNAGFTDEERRGIENLVAAGFVDTFRVRYPHDRRYTWWSHWGQARERNVGWRIDYFFISRSLLPHLRSAEIYENYFGSDHCPISITLDCTDGAADELAREAMVATAVDNSIIPHHER